MVSATSLTVSFLRWAGGGGPAALGQTLGVSSFSYITHVVSRESALVTAAIWPTPVSVSPQTGRGPASLGQGVPIPLREYVPPLGLVSIEDCLEL